MRAKLAEGLDRFNLSMMRIAALLRGMGLLCGLCLGSACYSQDLSPRAYVITPIHWNAIILTYTFNDGSILFDPSLPISDASGKLSTPTFSYFHTFSFFGRSANITASLPYAVGTFQGKANGTEVNLYRSGLLDTVYRLSVNLKGGPAMSVKEFATWRQKLLIGVSIKVVAPTGQYDPTKLVTPGTNRWSFKPEIGLSRRWGHWVLDGYGGVWFFTTNSDFFTPNQAQPHNTLKQDPMGSLEMHLSYDVRPKLWFSVDGNYWYGGVRSINGVASDNSLQSNSRIGGTASVPVGKHQSFKFSYSRGAVIRVGGDFQTISIAWQYSWLGRPN